MYVIKSANINKKNETVNSFKTKAKAAAYCKKENYKNHISNSCEHLYYEFDNRQLDAMREEMLKLV